MTGHTKKRYKFWASIKKDNVPVTGLERIICRILLPAKATGEIRVTFFPTRDQADLLEHLWEFSFSGEINRPGGMTASIIESKRALLKRTKRTSWNSDLVDIKAPARVEDLTITYFLSQEEPDKGDHVHAQFWLTPNRMLSDISIIEHHYKKGIIAKPGRAHIQAKLVNGMRLGFKHYFRFQNLDGGTFVFQELVAEYELFSRRKGLREIDEAVLKYVDDFLLLTSFASRRPCVCVGWDFGSSTISKQYYRRNVVIPKDTGQFYYNESLIGMPDFKDFIELAYKNFYSYEHIEALKLALYRVVNNEKIISERTFLSLYSAIETLIYDFRKRKNLEMILPVAEDWKHLKQKIKKVLSPVLKEHEKLKTNSTRRNYIYEKLDELNRIGFGTAVKEFCLYYSVDLTDLWPLTGEASLSDIRNKLVHGYSFSRKEETLITSAHENLRWTAERMLLAILGWPVIKSRASREFLDSNSTFFKDWQNHREELVKLMTRQSPELHGAESDV